MPLTQQSSAAHIEFDPVKHQRLLADKMQKKSEEATLWTAMRMASPNKSPIVEDNGRSRKVTGFEGKMAIARKERLARKEKADRDLRGPNIFAGYSAK